MGRRSINTTKSGKYMNPTDQARKEARKRELKKNKKQRMMVRQAVLKGKDPMKLIEDMEIIDSMEFNPLDAPKLNEKVLKDKRKKLKETFDRVVHMYEKEEPNRARDLRLAFKDYDKRRTGMQLYYEQVKNAERVQLDSIPLPDMPAIDSVPAHIPLPGDIPLPQMMEPSRQLKGILKSAGAHIMQASYSADPALMGTRKRKPPGPPPGDPPPLSDSEDEEPMSTEPPAKQRKIRFEDDKSQDSDEPEKDTRLRIKSKAVSSLHVRMLQMAGHHEHPLVKESSGPGQDDEDDEDDDEIKEPDELLEEIARKEQEEKAKKQLEMLKQQAEEEERKIQEAEKLVEEASKKQDGLPPGPPPGLPPGMPPGPPPGLPPMMFRPPPLRGALPVRLPPGPPPGRPPGMPPGPPMAPPPRLLSASGVPPRMLRPPTAPPGIPPPGVPPSQVINPNVLSAPPSIMKPPTMQDDDKLNSATIEAKPKLKNLIGDATRFMPTALKVRREVKDSKGRVIRAGGMSRASSLRPSGPAVQVSTKDDAYDQFMHEMEGLL